MSDSILVTGTIDLDPANHDAALELLRKITGPTNAEDGCEHYSITPDVDDAGRFHVSERWRDQAAIDAHMAGPNLAELMGAMGTLGVTGVALDKWSGATSEKLF